MLFFVLGTVVLVSAVIFFMCIEDHVDSLFFPISGIIAAISAMILICTLCEAGKSGDEFRKAEERGVELRELSTHLESIKDPIVKAKLTMEIDSWNKKLIESKEANASQWKDAFWDDGWGRLKPIEIPGVVK